MHRPSLWWDADAQAVTLVGWLQSVRLFGGMAFAVLRDRTGNAAGPVAAQLRSLLV